MASTIDLPLRFHVTPLRANPSGFSALSNFVMNALLLTLISFPSHSALEARPHISLLRRLGRGRTGPPASAPCRRLPRYRPARARPDSAVARYLFACSTRHLLDLAPLQCEQTDDRADLSAAAAHDRR